MGRVDFVAAQRQDFQNEHQRVAGVNLAEIEAFADRRGVVVEAEGAGGDTVVEQADLAFVRR
jgi:hypothetical protein